MKTTTFKKLIICLISTLLFTNPINAQISFDGHILNFGGAPENGRFSWIVDKFTGLYWTYGDKFFQIDLATANPRIAGTGNQVVFYNSVTSTHNDIQVANVYNFSDGRAKTNISTINNGLNTILNLRPVSYNWKNDNNNVNSRSTENTQTQSTEDTQYGFIAQEFEKVLPDAVTTDENGYKLINYTAVIPHLVQSIQELQGVVAEQKTEIENLTSQLNQSNSNFSLNKITKCTPNPTTGVISFEYTLIAHTSSASIFISDLTGDLKESFDCDTNSGLITEDLSNLRDGIYIASLAVNGEVKDSKQFVIRK